MGICFSKLAICGTVLRKFASNDRNFIILVLSLSALQFARESAETIDKLCVETTPITQSESRFYLNRINLIFDLKTWQFWLELRGAEHGKNVENQNISFY